MGYSNGSRVGTEWHSGAVGSPIYMGDQTVNSPMLRRNGASSQILFRTGDDSAYISIVCGTIIAGSGMSFNGNGFITPVADGVVRMYNNAATDFGRLCLGLQTALFPSLKRNAAGVDVRVGDDTAFTFMNMSSLFLNSAAAAAGAGILNVGATTQATIGANGAASALTANPLGYIIAFLGATKIVIPYYNG